jgi:hypothetical protein
MPKQSFLDRITHADLEEAGDIYLEARAVLPRDSAEWRTIVGVFSTRVQAAPVKSAEPLVSLRPSGR